MNMKRITFFTCACLAFILAACSSDSDDIKDSNSIVGHWMSVSRHTKTVFIDNDEIYNENDEDNYNLHLKLYEDGTCTRQAPNSGQPKLGTYKHLGTSLDIFIDNTSGGNTVYSYTILDRHGDNMTLFYTVTGRVTGVAINQETGEARYMRSEETLTMKRIE